MKRKRDEVKDPEQDSSDSVEIETIKVHKTSNDLNLKSVCTITYQNELSSRFCLQSVNECILLRSKTDNDIMRFEKNLGNHSLKLQLSSYKVKCSPYMPVESLKVDERKLYNSSNIFEKNDMMLSQEYFPRCVFKTYNVVKSQLSPYSNEDNVLPVLASLSSHGSLDFSSLNYDNDRNDLIVEEIAELCEIRKKSFSLASSYTKFGKLKEILNELTFSNFDWCPEIIDSTRFLAAVTKSNEIIIYSLDLDSEKAIVLQKFDKFEDVISELKWVIVANQNHFLFVANAKGDITRYSIDITEDGKVNKLEKLELTKGKLKIPVSNIQAELVDDSVFILCTKTHSLEIILFSSNNIVKSITKYIGMSVTGLTSISNSKPEYLITTLNNKIFYMKLSTTKGDLKIVQYLKMDNSVNPDIQPSKYSAYGITASKNKVLIFIALYPRIMFDHLALKQPLCISVNKNPLLDPYQMLLNNESLQLTELYDCVETVRFIGSLKLETLEPLESMEYRIAMSEEFLYYLKIQLLAVRTKLVYYQSRSDIFYAKLAKIEKYNKTLIEVMNAHFLLKFMISKKRKLSEQAQLSIHCICNFIRKYIVEEVDSEPFKAAQEILKKDLKALVDKCKDSIINPEVCSFCEEIIDKENLTCKFDHPLSRCVITKLQIPISMSNVCINCNCSVMDLETLKSVTGKINSQFLCPFCDQKFTFS